MKAIWRVLVVVLICVLTRAAWSGESSDLLEEWKVIETKASKQLLVQFQRQMQSIKSDRSLSAEVRHRYLSDLEEQRTRFAEDHVLPELDMMLQPTIAYLDTLHTAATPIRKNFEKQLEKVVGTPEFEKVVAQKDDWERRFPGNGELKARDEYHGTRMFLKANSLDFHFHILAMENNSFSGHIWQDVQSVSGKSGWACEGKLEGRQFVIATTKMLHGAPRTLHFRGYILNRRIVMTTTQKDGKPVTGDLISIWKK